MKQITFISLTCLLLISTFSSYPQNSNTVAKLYDDASLEKLSYSSIQPQNGILGTATPASAVEINNKAVRNFTKDYKKATGVKWMKTSGGQFAAYFSNDNIQSLVVYNKKGNYECMLRYYQEEKLPREIRGLVKSTYYDYDIYLITEVNRNEKIAYVVKMEDKTSWKTVKVVDGEMEVMEDYTKSN